MPNKYQEFQPRSFVSRRGVARDPSAQNEFYGHRAEDYMDEQDFGEFGIAPKKIRLLSGFADKTVRTSSCSTKNLRTLSESIGEKILRCMTRDKKCSLKSTSEPIIQKNDYHGLGYKPLKDRTRPSTCSRPLEATVERKKLRISGEAFGVGVLNEDDDEIHQVDEYGYDSIANYRFQGETRERSSSHNRLAQDSSLDTGDSALTRDTHALNDFILASSTQAMKICEDVHSKYPLPVIDDFWRQPKRNTPLLPPERVESKQNASLYKDQASKFSGRFTCGTSQTVKDDSINVRTGLIPYSDLKASESQQSEQPNEATHNDDEQSSITLNRRTVEWRPCSLLCKHFNVPNPYPDNAYFGVKTSSLSVPEAKVTTDIEFPLAPIDLRRQIFNITFEEHDEDADDEEEFSEDEPQVVETEPEKSETRIRQGLHPSQTDISDKSDEEPDVILIDAPKQEPEVIVLSSSSSSSSPREGKAVVRSPNQSDEEDTYGPPLPPSRMRFRTSDFKNSSESTSADRSRRSKHKKKSKKHKRSRRSR